MNESLCYRIHTQTQPQTHTKRHTNVHELYWINKLIFSWAMTVFIKNKQKIIERKSEIANHFSEHSKGNKLANHQHRKQIIMEIYVNLLSTTYRKYIDLLQFYTHTQTHPPLQTEPQSHKRKKGMKETCIQAEVHENTLENTIKRNAKLSYFDEIKIIFIAIKCMYRMKGI